MSTSIAVVSPALTTEAAAIAADGGALLALRLRREVEAAPAVAPLADWAASAAAGGLASDVADADADAEADAEAEADTVTPAEAAAVAEANTAFEPTSAYEHDK